MRTFSSLQQSPIKMTSYISVNSAHEGGIISTYQEAVKNVRCAVRKNIKLIGGASNNFENILIYCFVVI